MITIIDLRRFRLYRQQNNAGGWKYTTYDIAKLEHVSRQAVNQSLMKFPEYKKLRRSPNKATNHKLPIDNKVNKL